MSDSNEYAYGVTYTPDFVAAAASNVHSLNEHSLANQHLMNKLGIKYIRVQWLDLTNIVRYRLIPRDYMTKLLQSSRPGVTLTKVTLGMVGLNVAKGFSGVGEYLFVIDPSSFRICTYKPGHASVMGFFQEKTPTPEYGLTVPLCPRSLLKDIVANAERETGLKFLVGIESEFILLKDYSPESGKLVPVNDGDWSTSLKMQTGAPETEILEEIGDALIAARVELQMIHAEAAPGQYEVVTGPLGPLEAADALVFTRETIRNIAHKHGYLATFAPRLHADSCGSGAHVHISMHSLDPSSSSPHRRDASLAPTLTPLERSFLSGLLAHLSPLCALTLPTPASYGRVADGIWAAGTYVVWGTDNRETPIRLCGSPGSHHFEVRSVDATANMHVVLAGLLGSGVLGVKEGRELQLGDCRTPVFAMAEEEKRAYFRGQEVGRLPGRLEEARDMLSKDTALIQQVLGKEFVEKYLAVNEALQASLTGVNAEEEVAKLLKYY